MSNAILINGESAAKVAAVEAQLEEFHERTDKEHRILQENFRDVVCSAFNLAKDDHLKYELILTSKYYKQFGFMILEKDDNPMQQMFAEMGDDGSEIPVSKRIIN